MTKETSKWAYSFDGLHFDSDVYDSRDQAIAAARKARDDEVAARANDGGSLRIYLDIDVDGVFVVGQVIEYQPYIDGDSILESLSQQAYDEADEYSDGYLEGPHWDADKASKELWKKQVDDLSERLTAVFKEWAKETKNEPHFFLIGECEEVPFVRGDGA